MGNPTRSADSSTGIMAAGATTASCRLRVMPYDVTIRGMVLSAEMSSPYSAQVSMHMRCTMSGHSPPKSKHAKVLSSKNPQSQYQSVDCLRRPFVHPLLHVCWHPLCGEFALCCPDPLLDQIVYDVIQARRVVRDVAHAERSPSGYVAA
eukprot:SAG11_NODE_5583_length_1517_cov_2.405501_1_plen_149_part_00